MAAQHTAGVELIDGQVVQHTAGVELIHGLRSEALNLGFSFLAGLESLIKLLIGFLAYALKRILSIQSHFLIFFLSLSISNLFISLQIILGLRVVTHLCILTPMATY